MALVIAAVATVIPVSGVDALIESNELSSTNSGLDNIPAAKSV